MEDLKRSEVLFFTSQINSIDYECCKTLLEWDHCNQLLINTCLLATIQAVRKHQSITHKPRPSRNSPKHKLLQGTNGQSLSRHSPLSHFRGKHFFFGMEKFTSWEYVTCERTKDGIEWTNERKDILPAHFNAKISTNSSTGALRGHGGTQHFTIQAKNRREKENIC